MDRLIYYAIPAFVLLLVVELLSFKPPSDDDDLVGYETRDTRDQPRDGRRQRDHQRRLEARRRWSPTPALYELAPLRTADGRRRGPGSLLFFADDLAYYWFHRVHHEVRVFWASHVVHHSSEHFNLSTALRQTWTPMTEPAVLGAARPARLRAVDDPHPAVGEPDLPVLDPHRDA